MPSEEFDIMNCKSYSFKWIIDLSETCEDNGSGDLINCQCNDAEDRIDRGQIQCGDVCPEDCDVCEYCLYVVLGCGSPTSDIPSSPPSLVPSSVPSISPSSEPSSETSLLPSAMPSEEFDLMDCESYSDKWLRDLMETCENNDDGELINCQCNDAEYRISTGQIQCGNGNSEDLCPEDCAVCNFCLFNLLNCG